jgi:hypothetical protein
MEVVGHPLSVRETKGCYRISVAIGCGRPSVRVRHTNEGERFDREASSSLALQTVKQPATHILIGPVEKLAKCSMTGQSAQVNHN